MTAPVGRHPFSPLAALQALIGVRRSEGHRAQLRPRRPPPRSKGKETRVAIPTTAQKTAATSAHSSADPRAPQGEREYRAETASGLQGEPPPAPQQRPGCLPPRTHSPPQGPGGDGAGRRVFHRRAAPGPPHEPVPPYSNPSGIRDRTVYTQLGL